MSQSQLQFASAVAVVLLIASQDHLCAAQRKHFIPRQHDHAFTLGRRDPPPGSLEWEYYEYEEGNATESANHTVTDYGGGYVAAPQSGGNEVDRRFKRGDCARSCADGWMPYQGSCYLYSLVAHNYYEAETYCYENGSQLATFNTVEEMDFVSMRAPLGQHSWLGLSIHWSPHHDTHAQEQINWPSRFLSWAGDFGLDRDSIRWLVKPHPKYGFVTAENCVALYHPATAKKTQYHMHFYNCNVPKLFICERNRTQEVLNDELKQFLHWTDLVHIRRV